MTESKSAISLSGRRGLRNLLILGAAACVVIILWNAPVAFPAISALKDQNKVSILVYRKWLVSPSKIVVDLRSVSDDAAIVDIDRALFLIAESLKDHNFDSVELDFRGDARFILDGAHFNLIGKEWGAQNPMYIIRTLPEHIYSLDGQPAFGVWNGGWLGVLTKQLQDHNELHMRWWIRPLAGVKDPDRSSRPDYSEPP